MRAGDERENLNPQVFAEAGQRKAGLSDWDDAVRDPFDAREIFDLIRGIHDPEHPLTLEQLNVVSEDQCEVSDAENHVRVFFTPTIPHCGMAPIIGLSIRLKLLHTLPRRFKVEVILSPGSHASEAAINKQLADKERVAATLENPSLLAVVNKCIAPDHPAASVG